MVRWNRRIGLVLCLLWAGYGYGQDTLRDAQGRLLAYTDGYRVFRPDHSPVDGMAMPADAGAAVYRAVLVEAGLAVPHAFFLRLRQTAEGEVPASVAILRAEGDSVRLIAEEVVFSAQRDVLWAGTQYLLLRIGSDAVVYDLSARRQGPPSVELFAKLEPYSAEVLPDGGGRLWLVHDSLRQQTGLYRLNLRKLKLSRISLLDPTQLLALHKRRSKRLALPAPSLAQAVDSVSDAAQTRLAGTQDVLDQRKNAVQAQVASKRDSLLSPLQAKKDSLRAQRAALEGKAERLRGKAAAARGKAEQAKAATKAAQGLARTRTGTATKPTAGMTTPGGTAAASASAGTASGSENARLVGRGDESPLWAPRQIRDKRFNYWAFGSGGGLSFNSGMPQVESGNAIDQLEGSAAISDTAGRLLFYTDGQTVWTRSHRVMEGGTGLYGHASSTQSALIVPAPGSSTRYYVFTTDQSGYAGLSHGLNYSVVDLALGNGAGEVVQKNVPLAAHAAEKLAATTHANGQDIWVVAHALDTNAFLAFPVSADGVGAPVVSPVGSVHPSRGNGGIGQMKLSLDGTRLALAVNETWAVEAFRFDPETGLVTEGTDLNRELRIPHPYGVEFSPDGAQLYVSSQRCAALTSIRLADGSSCEIRDTTVPAGVHVGALQLGPDERLYGVYVGHPHLLVLPTPNAGQPEPQQLGAAVAGVQIGLPTVLATYTTRVQARFTWIGGCAGQPVQFVNLSTPGYTRVHWDFGDGTSSTEVNPVKVYTGALGHQATLTTWYGENDFSNVSHRVSPNDAGRVAGRIAVNLGTTRLGHLVAPTPGETVTVDGKPVPAPTYLSQPGVYRVTKRSGGCQEVFEVMVMESLEKPQVRAKQYGLKLSVLLLPWLPAIAGRSAPLRAE